MSKKKESKKEKIKYFLNEAHYYNNIKRYKKAAQNVCLAKGIWMEYKKDNHKTRKLLDLITDIEELVANNYITSKEEKIYNILRIEGMVFLDK